MMYIKRQHLHQFMEHLRIAGRHYLDRQGLIAPQYMADERDTAACELAALRCLEITFGKSIEILDPPQQ